MNGTQLCKCCNQTLSIYCLCVCVCICQKLKSGGTANWQVIVMCVLGYPRNAQLFLLGGEQYHGFVAEITEIPIFVHIDFKSLLFNKFLGPNSVSLELDHWIIGSLDHWMVNPMLICGSPSALSSILTPMSAQMWRCQFSVTLW